MRCQQTDWLGAASLAPPIGCRQHLLSHSSRLSHHAGMLPNGPATPSRRKPRTKGRGLRNPAFEFLDP
jgi:hypothetical protein